MKSSKLAIIVFLFILPVIAVICKESDQSMIRFKDSVMKRAVVHILGSDYTEEDLLRISSIKIYTADNSDPNDLCVIYFGNKADGWEKNFEIKKQIKSYEDLKHLPNLETLSIVFDTSDNTFSQKHIEELSQLNQITCLNLDTLYPVDYSCLESMEALETLHFSRSCNEHWDEKYLLTLPQNIPEILISPAIKIDSIPEISEHKNIVSLAVNIQGASDYDILNKLINLKSLTLRGVRETSVRFPALVNLEYLELHDVSSLNGYIPVPNLQTLIIESDLNNNFSDLSPISGQTSLTKLSITTRSTTDLSLKPLSKMTQMEKLRINAEFMSSLDGIEKMSKLIYFYGTKNLTEDIAALKNLHVLETVNLGDNLIQDISPLANHSSLHYLYIRGNEITDISPLRTCENLVLLDLNWNAVADITPLKSKMFLKVLYMEGIASNTLATLNTLLTTLPELEWIMLGDRGQTEKQENLAQRIEQSYPELMYGNLEAYPDINSAEYTWKITPPIANEIVW